MGKNPTWEKRAGRRRVNTLWDPAIPLNNVKVASA
jgi:hypothetical protein